MSDPELSVAGASSKSCPASKTAAGSANPTSTACGLGGKEEVKEETTKPTDFEESESGAESPGHSPGSSTVPTSFCGETEPGNLGEARRPTMRELLKPKHLIRKPQIKDARKGILAPKAKAQQSSGSAGKQ